MVITIIGLEYILTLYEMQHIDLANKLGIKKQNINMWIKGKQKVPKKYLPILEDLFCIDKEYFSKDIDEIDKLEIQKEKLKRDLSPIIKENEKRFMVGESDEMIDVPIYDKDGEEKIIKSDLIPMYPIVVLKDNERIVANEYSNLSRSNFSSTNFTFSSKSGITYSFLGESFNNMKQKNIKNVFA